MAYTFNGTTKIIQLSTGVVTLDVRDLYSRWVDWVVISDNIKYSPVFRVVGGDALPGSRSLGLTYFMQNGWKIRPQEANHDLTVIGNLYTEEGNSPFVSTIGNYNVLISLTTSNLIDVVTNNTGSGLSTDEHNKLFSIPNDTVSVLNTAVIPVNTVQIKGQIIEGSGTELDPWGP